MIMLERPREVCLSVKHLGVLVHTEPSKWRLHNKGHTQKLALFPQNTPQTVGQGAKPHHPFTKVLYDFGKSDGHQRYWARQASLVAKIDPSKRPKVLL